MHFPRMGVPARTRTGRRGQGLRGQCRVALFTNRSCPALLLLFGVAGMMLAGIFPRSLSAQAAPSITNGEKLPNAPNPAGQADGAASKADSATLSGTVLDTNGSEVQGATVTLSPASGNGRPISLKSGSNGEFTFAALPAGRFTLKVSGKGWGTYVSPVIQLHAGEFRLVRDVRLPLATSAVVRVEADPEVLAEEQVKIAEQQRVMGIFPNFYTSYDWNAPPLGPKQKYELAFRSMIDPVTFLSAAGIAGAEQYVNAFSGYGGGFSGYAKRYGATYGSALTAHLLGYAVLPSIFHQDPRYFYRGTGTVTSRAMYAISAAVMTRTDSGRWRPAYAHILGSFAAGGLTNLYYPQADRGASLTFINGALSVASYAGDNLVREFIIKKFTTKAKASATQP